MQTVKSILEKKTFVASVTKESPVLDAVEVMDKRNIGSLVVTDGDKVVGIFTERDALKRILAKGLDPAKTAVDAVMTAPVAVCRPDTSLDECTEVMTRKRIRHLPVVSKGKLVGIVTSGDILAQQVVQHAETIEYLNQYMFGPTPSTDEG